VDGSAPPFRRDWFDYTHPPAFAAVFGAKPCSALPASNRAHKPCRREHQHSQQSKKHSDAEPRIRLEAVSFRRSFSVTTVSALLHVDVSKLLAVERQHHARSCVVHGLCADREDRVFAFHRICLSSVILRAALEASLCVDRTCSPAATRAAYALAGLGYPAFKSALRG